MGLILRHLALVGLVAIGACAAPVEAQSTGGGLAKCVVDNVTMGGKCTIADPLRSLVSFSVGVFGDGSDGPCVFDGTTTVAGYSAPALGSALGLNTADFHYNWKVYLGQRDIFCTTLVVSTDVVVSGQGYRIFASQSVTTNGTSRITNAGTTGFTGASGGAGGFPPGCGVLPGCGGLGGAGNSGAGSNGTNGANGRPSGWPSTNIANAGHGGAGAAAGGVGGTFGSLIAAASGNFHTLETTISSHTTTNFIVGSIVPSGAGGGGDNAGHKGGGGGGPCSWIVVASPIITTNGTSKIDCDGGTGGEGNAIGNTGGGGGGTAGIVVVVYTGTAPRTSATGGGGGIGHNGGATGVAGNDGVVYSWKVGVQ